MTIVTPNGGWLREPEGGSFQPIPADQLKGMVTVLDIQSPLLDAKSKGTAVELAGTEKVEGKDQFKLKLTFSNGIVAYYFIDKTTYLITKVSKQLTINGNPVDSYTTYSNYRKNADGFLFAFSMTTQVGEQFLTMFRLRSIETNIPLDPSIFSPK